MESLFLIRLFIATDNTILFTCWAREFYGLKKLQRLFVKVGPPVHDYEHEAGSYGDGFT
jgi:hypothetical protein